MDKIINLEILKSPLNWLIVISILTFAFYCIYVVSKARAGESIASAVSEIV